MNTRIQTICRIRFSTFFPTTGNGFLPWGMLSKAFTAFAGQTHQTFCARKTPPCRMIRGGEVNPKKLFWAVISAAAQRSADT